MSTERSTVMFATRLKRHGGVAYLAGFMKNERVARFCFGKPVERVVVRDLREAEASEYWAWWDAEKKDFMFVYPYRNGVEMCFPYGTRIAIERNNGEVVNVTVEETSP